MKNILEKNMLYDFVKKWRKHFVDNMNPQFLPKYWSINSPLEKSGRVEKV